MKKKITAVCLAAGMALSLCSCTFEQAAQSAIDIINSVGTADSEEIKQVKNGHLPQYSSSITVGQAFDNFLTNPMWQYFEAESGEKVVQCNGTCTYDDKTIEAKTQFLLNDDDTFEVGAITFNDLEQNILVSAAFMLKVYETAEKNLGKTITQETQSKPTENPPTPEVKTQSSEQQGTVMYVANVQNSVYLRTAPASDSNIGTVPLGAEVKSIGWEKGSDGIGYNQVEYNGQRGWIKSEYLSSYRQSSSEWVGQYYGMTAGEGLRIMGMEISSYNPGSSFTIGSFSRKNMKGMEYHIDTAYAEGSEYVAYGDCSGDSGYIPVKFVFTPVSTASGSRYINLKIYRTDTGEQYEPECIFYPGD